MSEPPRGLYLCHKDCTHERHVMGQYGRLTNCPNACNKVVDCGGSCCRSPGHPGECECIGDTPGEPGTCPA